MEGESIMSEALTVPLNRVTNDSEEVPVRYGLVNRLVSLIKAGQALSHRLLAVILALAIWEVAPRIGLVPAAFLPPLSQVLVATAGLAASGQLATHISISLQRALSGFLLAFIVAIPGGMIIGWYKPFERFIDPLLQSFRQTSALALFPVFILFLGIGEESKTAIVFWGAQWAMLLNTISGVKEVDPILIKAARSMAVPDRVLFRKVVFPAAIPSVITGMRLSATTSILILVAAEMIGAKAGLGFLLVNSQYNFEVDKMYSAIITLAVLGLTVNYLLVWLERRASSWKRQSVAL